MLPLFDIFAQRPIFFDIHMPSYWLSAHIYELYKAYARELMLPPLQHAPIIIDYGSFFLYDDFLPRYDAALIIDAYAACYHFSRFLRYTLIPCHTPLFLLLTLFSRQLFSQVVFVTRRSPRYSSSRYKQAADSARSDAARYSAHTLRFSPLAGKIRRGVIVSAD